MTWVFFALTSVFLFSVSSLIQRVLMKDEQSDAHAYSIAFQLLAGVIILFFAVSQGFELPPITTYPINFLLLAGLYGVGTLFLFNSLKHLEASEVTIVTSLRAIVTIISAILILGESFSLQKGIGTILILSAIFLVSEKTGRIKLNKGFFYAIGMAVCYGLAITNDAFLLKHSSIYSYTAVGFILPGLFLIAVSPKKIIGLKSFLKTRTFIKMLLLTILYSTGSLSFYSALESGANASQATPILQSTVIVTVMLAAIFLKERTRLMQKTASAILVTIGIVLLA